MNRFLALLLTALVAQTAAFSVAPHGSKVASATRTMKTTPFSYPAVESSSTALHLRVKVDPEDMKQDRINPAVFKNAAYVGSVLIALALPLFFLLK